MKTILFFHQSADLYGSDKTLLYLLKDIKEDYKLIILLPEDGLLCNKLKDLNIEFHITPLFKISRQSMKISNILLSPFKIYSYIKKINKLIGKRKIDIIYSNTAAIIIGGIWAKINKTTHIWHIHEIINKPNIARYIYATLAKNLSSIVVCNSHSTKNWILNNKTTITDRYKVIWNGIKKIDLPLNETNDKEITISLIGRLSHWKGQKFLLKTTSQLVNEKITNIKIKIVGSAHKLQPNILNDLQNYSKTLNIEEYVEFIPYTEKISEIYKDSDIIVIPSIEPEPFGLVAIEGMSFKKPIIASDHGGVTEIVKNYETGLLFKPNDVYDFKSSLINLIKNKEMRISMGIKGFERYEKNFTVDSYINKLRKVLSII